MNKNNNETNLGRYCTYVGTRAGEAAKECETASHWSGVRLWSMTPLPCLRIHACRNSGKEFRVLGTMAYTSIEQSEPSFEKSTKRCHGVFFALYYLGKVAENECA